MSKITVVNVFLVGVILETCTQLSSTGVQAKCFEGQTEEIRHYKKQILFIESNIGETCYYQLGSGYLDGETEKTLAFDGVNVFVKLTSSEKEFELSV